MNNRFIIWGLAFSVGLNLVLVTMVSVHLSQGLWPAPRANTAARSPVTHTLNFNEADMTRLKLAPAQRRQFRRFNQQWFLAERTDKVQGEERIARISALLVQDDLTSATLQPLYVDLRRHSVDYFQRLTRLIREYRAVLNPRQREVFNTMLQNRFALLRQYARSKNSEYEKLMTETIRRDQQNEQPAATPADKKGKAKAPRGNRAAAPAQ